VKGRELRADQDGFSISRRPTTLQEVVWLERQPWIGSSGGLQSGKVEGKRLIFIKIKIHFE
jgi:hypothetical protein